MRPGAGFLFLLVPLGLLLVERPKASAEPVVLISIDGLMPEYYLEPDRLRLQIPNLRALVREGAFAVGAVSVLPSVTFPAHTTMITGVNPRRHGIGTNEVFDPDGSLGGGWHWYYDDIKVPTLFDRARTSNLKTAAVTWPVTAGAPIDFNLPDMYPVPNLREAKNLLSLARGGRDAPPWREVLQGPHDLVNMKDEVRTKVAVRFLRERPDLTVVHFLELDSAQHSHGPRAPEALATLERIDGYLGQILEAVRAEGQWDTTTVMVVSDHGFVTVEREVRIGVLLRTLGLLQTDARGRVTFWRAMPWVSGGTAAIYLRSDATAADRRKVDDAIRLLRSNPVYGVAKVWREHELVDAGGFPGAYLALEAEPGFAFSSALHVSELIGEIPPRGTHGHSPTRSELRGAFVMRGPRVRRNKNLGIVRLADVAPTAAKILGFDLGEVEGRVLTSAFTKD
jgi:predicted AlkP superfamily pyrophosphatase or phosphodiesterase